MRYYAYYNFGGGYKDLYLGCSTDSAEFCYLLPLLFTLSQEEQEALSGLTMMHELKDGDYGFPKEAVRLFSHSSYKIMLRRYDGDELGLAVRDIAEKMQDDNGRDNYCTILFLSENNEDKILLKRLTKQFFVNYEEWGSFIAGLFKYDIEHNGYSFALRDLNKKLRDPMDDVPGVVLQEGKTILFLSKPKSYSVEFLLEDLKYSKDDIGTIVDFPYVANSAQEEKTESCSQEGAGDIDSAAATSPFTTDKRDEESAEKEQGSSDVFPYVANPAQEEKTESCSQEGAGDIDSAATSSPLTTDKNNDEESTKKEQESSDVLLYDFIDFIIQGVEKALGQEGKWVERFKGWGKSIKDRFLQVDNDTNDGNQDNTANKEDAYDGTMNADDSQENCQTVKEDMPRSEANSIDSELLLKKLSTIENGVLGVKEDVANLATSFEAYRSNCQKQRYKQIAILAVIALVSFLLGAIIF